MAGGVSLLISLTASLLWKARMRNNLFGNFDLCSFTWLKPICQPSSYPAGVTSIPSWQKVQHRSVCQSRKMCSIGHRWDQAGEPSYPRLPLTKNTVILAKPQRNVQNLGDHKRHGQQVVIFIQAEIAWRNSAKFCTWRMCNKCCLKWTEKRVSLDCPKSRSRGEGMCFYIA